MGREVRRVPASWQHPVDREGRPVPLHGRSYAEAERDWVEAHEKWERGFMRSFGDEPWRPKNTTASNSTFEEWYGKRPDPANYMPDWPEAERTHWQMYENTSEGTPISPVLESPEALARWLADNGASAFAHLTATYDEWLHMIRQGFSVSAVYMSDGLEMTVKSGVAALSDVKR